MASIHQVILDGRLSQLNLLINRIGCNVNEKDAYGRTPLHLAVLSDQENYGYRLAQVLLQANADINANDLQEQTPFIYACLLNRSKLISLFIQTNSIDWYHSDCQGYLALHHAVVASKTSILAEIVHRMDSADYRTELGYTPLILAIKSFRFDNAIYLLDHTDASLLANDEEFHLTCQQWVENVGPKFNQWTYSHHERQRTKTFDQKSFKSLKESTYTPAILSPCSKDRKSLSLSAHLKSSYQQWMELVQRLHDRTKIPQEKKVSPWYNAKLNSNKQVIQLLNHYSSILSADNHEQLISNYHGRPKSILRSRGSMKNYRSPKEVTFAIN